VVVKNLGTWLKEGAKGTVEKLKKREDNPALRRDEL